MKLKHLHDFNYNKTTHFSFKIYLPMSTEKENIELSYINSWLTHQSLSAKRAACLLHGWEKHSCPTHTQACIFKTKMVPAIGVYMQIEGRRTKFRLRWQRFCTGQEHYLHFKKTWRPGSRRSPVHDPVGEEIICAPGVHWQQCEAGHSLSTSTKT